ncbi:hypothetical protein LCGC14_2157890 [marine sediment metagenome]|uniref:Uncharacterized protein n=1 Tax=marine sediment metagenome TaxID=412755 RepID=A0A0F9EFU2_9ZZZZ
MDQAETRLHPTLPIADGFITPESYIAEWEGLIKVEQAERRALLDELEAHPIDPCPIHGYSDLEGDERCPDCVLEEIRERREYLKDYTYAAGQIHSNLGHMGWARAKGFYKRIIRDLAQSYPYGPHLPLAHVDAILDSVN